MMSIRGVNLAKLTAVRIKITSRAFATSGHIEPAETFPDGWEKAKRFEDIPGISGFGFLRAMLPGGIFHKVQITEMQRILYTKFGPLCKLPGMLGEPPMVFSSNPDHSESVFRTEGVWPKRKSMDVFAYYRAKVRPEIFKGYGGLVSDQGKTWHELRTVINPVLMPLKVAKSYVPAVDAVARDFLQRVDRMRDANDEMPATFANEMSLWALESIGVIALDRRLGVIANERNEDANLLIQSVKEFFRLSYHLEITPPIWKYVATREFNEIIQVFENMTRLIKPWLDESLEQIKSASADGIEINESSVLQKLLRIDPHFAFLMTFDMLMAGIDTTSSATAIFLHHLAENPAEQEKLRAEVLRILPDREQSFQVRDLDHMPYMRACIKESMRIKPIVMGNMRAVGQNLILDGYRIPKDTSVVMAYSLVATDNKYFPNGVAFKPERWLRDTTDENAALKSQHPFAFLPFGFGSRSCPGRRLANMEMQILVARILRDYRIEWHHGPMEYATAILTTPSSDLKFRFVPL